MKANLLVLFLSLLCLPVLGQTIGSVKTEAYQADFEKKQSIDVVSDYEGPKIPIQLLSIGITDEIFAMYPELKDKRVGLGLTNIVVEFLEETNRFTFTEDKAEIKNRMVKQFQASQSGITENKLDGRGKIKLAQYFVYVEVYDFSVSEDEQLKLKDGVALSDTKGGDSPAPVPTTEKKGVEIDEDGDGVMDGLDHDGDGKIDEYFAHRQCEHVWGDADGDGDEECLKCGKIKDIEESIEG